MKTKELRAEMIRNGMTYEKACKAIGISMHAFKNKVNRESEFKASEIKKLKDLLNLDMQRVDDIFFG